MKKNLLTCAALGMSYSLFAQLPVSTTPANKNVILEEFTGIHCGYCPDGHRISQEIYDNNPNDVILINIHTGSYAQPSGSEPDFRTTFGTAIAGQTNLAGYPAGTVNRREFSGSQQNGSGTAMSRNKWTDAANIILGESSYANVALEASIDVNSREMIVNVEIYFTASGASSVNLNVALTQDGILGPQSGASLNPSMVQADGNYMHNHMLRHLLTGQWGEVINTTGSGTLVQKQYTYTLPGNINNVPLELGKLHVVAFIAEGQQTIVTGSNGPITYNGLATDNGQIENVMLPEEICGSSITPVIKIRNNGGNAMTSAVIATTINGNTTNYNWSGNLGTFESETVTLPTVTDANGGNLTVEITSINGNSDSDPSDNTANATAVISNNTAEGTQYEFKVVQDRYGSEITWEIVNDANGNTVASGGPYSDLTSNGTAEHLQNITLSTVGCYTIKMYDSYGDGFNAGYGVGSYSLKQQNGIVVLTSDANFASEQQKVFKLTTLNSVEELASIENFNVYPNPASNVVNIELNLNTLLTTVINIFNNVGQLVLTSNNLKPGYNKTQLDMSQLSNGLYTLQIANAQGKITKHLSIAK